MKRTQSKRESVLVRFARDAVRLGADAIEVEYRDGYEEIMACRGNVGAEIARVPSGGGEAAALRAELYRLTKRSKRLDLGQRICEVRARVYDSFGEDAFRVELGGRTSA